MATTTATASKPAIRTLQVPGSNGRSYAVTLYIDGSAYCTCPSWKNNTRKAPRLADRACKHTDRAASTPVFSA